MYMLHVTQWLRSVVTAERESLGRVLARRTVISYIDVDKTRVCRRTAALFFPDARLMRRPSPIDVALKVGWSLVFGVGLQQPTFIGSQQEKTDDQQTNAKKTDDQ